MGKEDDEGKEGSVKLTADDLTCVANGSESGLSERTMKEYVVVGVVI